MPMRPIVLDSIAASRSFERRGFSLRVVLAGAIVFAVPFILFYRLILFHFYVRGAMLSDTGRLGALMWHNTAALRQPPMLGGESFFAVHVAPMLLLVSAISHVLPLSMPQMFASFVGVCHGLLALAVFWLLVDGYGMRRGGPLALAALASGAFAFNGLAIAIARFPHFETLAAACLLLFLVALVLERRAIAIAAFACALATREDVGLHAFGFLAVWLAANRLRGEPWRSDAWIIGFALTGLLYSATVLLAQHVAFPGHSSFARIYLGNPPFAGLTLRRVGGRLLALVKLHAAILLPAIGTGWWASRTHNPFLLLGYAACIPWTLLNLLASSELAGWMVGYYAFPFLVAMAWPWLAIFIRRRPGPDPAAATIPLTAGLLAMIAASLLPIGQDWDDEGRMPMPRAFLHAPSVARRALTDHAIAAIAEARPALGRLIVDESVAALSPFAFPSTEIAKATDDEPDTVVFFEHGFDADRLRAAPGLPLRYAVPGTAIRIATDRREQTMRALGIPLEATP
jgi:hypothetical protein